MLLEAVQRGAEMIEEEREWIEYLKSMAVLSGQRKDDDPVQSSISDDKMGDIIAEYVTLQHELAEEIKIQKVRKQRLTEEILQLKDNMQVMMLIKVYVELLPIKAAARQLGISRQYAYHIHNVAAATFKERNKEKLRKARKILEEKRKN